MWIRVVTFLLIGYICMGRSFAYWGVPPLHVFVGELALAFFLVLGPRTGQGRWLWIATRNPLLHRYKKAFLIFLIFGVVEALRGIFSGNAPLLALRDLALNYYPLYFFMGFWGRFA